MCNFIIVNRDVDLKKALNFYLRHLTLYIEVNLSRCSEILNSKLTIRKNVFRCVRNSIREAAILKTTQ